MKLNLKNCEIGTVTTTKDKWMKVVIYTPEMSAVDMALLFEATKTGIVDDMDIDYTQEGKTPSERLRNVMYAVFMEEKRMWLFENYYRDEMESIINRYKSKLPPI